MGKMIKNVTIKLSKPQMAQILPAISLKMFMLTVECQQK